MEAMLFQVSKVSLCLSILKFYSDSDRVTSSHPVTTLGYHLRLPLQLLEPYPLPPIGHFTQQISLFSQIVEGGHWQECSATKYLNYGVARSNVAESLRAPPQHITDVSRKKLRGRSKRPRNEPAQTIYGGTRSVMSSIKSGGAQGGRNLFRQNPQNTR